MSETHAPLPDPELLAAERAAPVNTSRPLPLRVSTLQYVPKERWAQYERDMDGAFILAFIHQDDAASMKAYMSDIAAGALKVFAPGDSPAQAAEREAANDALKAEVMRLLDEREQIRRNEQIARERAALEEEHAREMEAIDRRRADDRKRQDFEARWSNRRGGW